MMLQRSNPHVPNFKLSLGRMSSSAFSFSAGRSPTLLVELALSLATSHCFCWFLSLSLTTISGLNLSDLGLGQDKQGKFSCMRWKTCRDKALHPGCDLPFWLIRPKTLATSESPNCPWRQYRFPQRHLVKANK